MLHLSKHAKKNKSAKPPYNMWQNSWYMIALAWREQEKKVPILCFLAATFAVLTNLVELYIAPAILGAVERRAPLTELFRIILFFVLANMICSGIFAYVSANHMYGRITVRSALITALNSKAATTSFPNMEEEDFTSLLTKAQRITGSNDQATEAIWRTLTHLLKNAAGFAVYLSLLSVIQPVLLLVIILTTAIGYFITKQLNSYRYRHKNELSDHEKTMWYLLRNTHEPDVAKDIRIFGLKPWMEELISKSKDAFLAFEYKVQNVVIWGSITDLLLAFLRNAIAYAYLINLILNGTITAAEFLLYFSAVGGFSTWIQGILENLTMLHKQSLDICTVRECLEYPEVFVFKEGEPMIPEQSKSYEIQLDNVSFRYPGAEKDTLSHINLTLHPGERLAVVGLNGAGKTTLIKLLCGFVDPTEGRVLLNGKDIRNYNRRHYYQLFSAVFQEFSLLAGTIAVNVAQTEDSIDRNKVKECISKAGLREKVESLPEQYETLMNRTVYEDATVFSGGETQRLMLARALYKDAPIIVLDEPTAALDAIAESEMYQKYHEMTAGKSAVYISHRLASTRFCDRIILIENAGIAEEGTHDSLLAKQGRYAQLFAVQSQYYQEGAQDHEN